MVVPYILTLTTRKLSTSTSRLYLLSIVRSHLRYGSCNPVSYTKSRLFSIFHNYLLSSQNYWRLETIEKVRSLRHHGVCLLSNIAIRYQFKYFTSTVFPEVNH